MPLEKRHPLHSMCSYLGCFPPQVPRRVIREVMPSDGYILDPFCGSGTTMVESVLLGRPCIGIDLNPLAVALALAKVQTVSLEDVLDRLIALARHYPGRADLEAVPEDVRIFFHSRTLSQLVYLRHALDLSQSEDLFIRGALLGIMHGKWRKGGGTAYLSIDMPNTFSMSPGYVRKFVEKHKLVQPPVDTFAQLRERCTHLLREGALPRNASARVIGGDATQLPRLLEAIGVENVAGIVTSPPYLGVLRYGAFNWIRLWFLGYEPAPIDRMLDSTDSLDRYLSFMASFLAAAAKVLKPGGRVALVVGDVVEFGQDLRLAQRIWDELNGVVPFKFTELRTDDFDTNVKTTRIWGEERTGRATPGDRGLVLERQAGGTKGRSARGASTIARAVNA